MHCSGNLTVLSHDGVLEDKAVDRAIDDRQTFGRKESTVG